MLFAVVTWTLYASLEYAYILGIRRSTHALAQHYVRTAILHNFHTHVGSIGVETALKDQQNYGPVFLCMFVARIEVTNDAIHVVLPLHMVVQSAKGPVQAGSRHRTASAAEAPSHT